LDSFDPSPQNVAHHKKFTKRCLLLILLHAYFGYIFFFKNGLNILGNKRKYWIRRRCWG